MMGTAKKQHRKLKEEIFIIGEGITEQYYFSHLKFLKQYKCVVKPRFFGKTSLDEIDKTAQKLLSGGVTVVCVFDTDVSERDEVEKEKLKNFIRKYKNDRDIIICDSLPSIEYWFLLHFVKINKSFKDAKEVIKELKQAASKNEKSMANNRNPFKNYEKTKKYLENSGWVKFLIQNQSKAFEYAKSLGQKEGHSYTNIYKAFDFLTYNT